MSYLFIFSVTKLKALLEFPFPHVFVSYKNEKKEEERQKPNRN